MSRLPNEDAEVPELRRLHTWWLELPLAYRVNALLYLLGGVALTFLLVTLLSSDGRPRQVQVGAGIPVTTATTVKPAPTTARASSSTSSPSSSTTSTTGGTTTTSQSNPTTTRTVDTTSATVTPATTSPATTTPPNCRNSSNPACGAFAWDPQPAANQGLTVTVVPRQTTAKSGDLVTFDVTVDDPDHVVNDNCSEVRFDNGTAADGPCSPPPDCPARHGPWTPPAARVGHHTGIYSNTWVTTVERTAVATFTFRSWSSDTCLALDPYASEGTKQVTVTITVAP